MIETTAVSNIIEEGHIKAGHIYVICSNKMCFWVDPITSEPLSVSCYDPYWDAPSAPRNRMSEGVWLTWHMPILMRSYGIEVGDI